MTIKELLEKNIMTKYRLSPKSIENRCSFELYKSNVCHKLKDLGDIDFLIETLKSDDIRIYYKKKWYPECLYIQFMPL